MAPLILLVVDGDASGEALLAEFDRYARDYRVEAAIGGAEAIDRLGTLAEAGDAVAMVLAEIALQPIDAIDVLNKARALAPTAKRVLLVDWGLRPEQTAAVSRPALVGLVDSVLTKPTGPRDEEFHGTLTEDLGDWAWTEAPVVEAVKVVGEGSSGRVGEIRDLLERLAVPTGVHPADSPTGRAIIASAGPDAALPVVEVMGRTVLVDPSDRRLAEAFGVVADVAAVIYDLAIVGAGPAGLGAAVYGASEGLSTLLLEAVAFGGQAGTSSMIRNYLGFPRGISGRQLGRRATLQAVRFGAALDLARSVTALDAGTPHRLALSDGAVASAHAVLVACGVTYRRIGVPPLEDLVGAGVFYGAVGGHARALEGVEAVVVGAGNSGGQAAVHLARHAARVTLVARGAALKESMSAYLVDEVAADERIVVRTETDVVGGGGDGHLEWIELADRRTGRRERIDASTLFVLIGTETRTAWLPAAIQCDDHGFVLTGADIDRTCWPLPRPPYALETSVPGVFAAGDVRANGVKRVAAAVGEGAVSVPMIHRFLDDR
jgi:thioredoxin reductase (NADPH)